LWRLILVGAFVVAAAIPTTASAAGGPATGMTVTIGSPITLTDRLLITVPVTVSCPTPLANPVFFGGISVSVQQAFGQSVSTGFGGAALTSCTSSPQTFAILVTPSQFPAPSGPFHGGPAVVSAFANICDTSFACLGGSAGPLGVRI
jgi:hypothetical protein